MGEAKVHSFYPFADAAADAAADAFASGTPSPLESQVRGSARIAVVDDPAAAPRVVLVEPAPVRDYLETITQTTDQLAREQGGSIPFMVIREIVENLIHAYFTDPVITILPGGNTIRISDQGPGIERKREALEYGTTTATEAMKRYIRGVGSGLPYVTHYLEDKGGTLTIEDNLEQGTVVTMSLDGHRREAELPALGEAEMRALTLLERRGSLGPTELTREFGGSAPTWSRRLRALEEAGLAVKRGQKRFLTRRGSELLASLHRS